MTITTTVPGRLLLVGPVEALHRTSALLSTRHWLITTLNEPREALSLLRNDSNFHLVLLAPDCSLQTYTELCRAIKFDRRTSFLSVMFITGPEHAQRTEDFLDAGADDCIPVTASDREIDLRMQRAIRIKQAADSLEDAEALITSLARAIEGKDKYTCGHVDRVGDYCVEIGRRFGLGPADLAALRKGGVVHDIGKIGIPDHILNKPGKLTDEEMDIMRRHPVIGYDILKPLRTFRAVLPIVRWHHERPNGSGYPDGLAGDELPVLPRITAVADVFDALSTDRPYRKAFPLPQCRTIMIEAVDRGDLDGDLAGILFDIIETGLGADLTAPAA